MRNKILPLEDQMNAKAIIEKVNIYVEKHGDYAPRFDNDDNDTLQRIHTLMYLDVIGDLVKSAMLLESLLEDSPEEFAHHVTNGGERTVEETERLLMTSAIVDILKNLQ